MYLRTSELSPSENYFTLIQTLVPRPVAWVLSDNGNGSYNLAPFSYFSGVSSKPPMLMFVAGKKPSGQIKDTRNNIIERKQFVVHIPHTSQAQAVTDSAANFEAGESEISALALETTDFDGVDLPRLTASKIAYACDLYKVDEITEDQAVIYGLIKAIYIDDSIVSEVNGRLKVDAKTLDPLARLGGDDYSGIGETFSVERAR